MARGFRGMKDDFMEIVNHIIWLSCCSVGHDDNDESQLLPLPQPNVGDFAFLEVSQVFSASNTKVRDTAATDDVPCSSPACTAPVDDGTCRSSPQAKYAVIDEGLDPGVAAVSNTLGPTFPSEENFWRGYHASLNIKHYGKDSESLYSSRKVKENHSSSEILERYSSSRPCQNPMASNELEEEQGTCKERSFDSASDVEDYYNSKKEGEDVSIQKHMLVEDHIPSISFSEGLQLRKRTNKTLDDEEIKDYSEIDGFEYVIV